MAAAAILRPPSWKNFKWPYLRNWSSAPLHVGYRVGFSGTADLMAPFSIRTNSRWRPPPSWLISNGHISATAHDLLIYRASRAVIFAIAQLSCLFLLFSMCHYAVNWCDKLRFYARQHICDSAYMLSPFCLSVCLSVRQMDYEIFTIR